MELFHLNLNNLMLVMVFLCVNHLVVQDYHILTMHMMMRMRMNVVILNPIDFLTAICERVSASIKKLLKMWEKLLIN